MSEKKSYGEYFIKDGKLIGQFEEMYKNCDDPWEQSKRERGRSEKFVGLNLIRKSGARRVLELGCGLGHYTAEIAAQGVEVLGVDISETAIAKARALHPGLAFKTGGILDEALFREFRPDLLVMAEITWCILPQLDDFLALYKRLMPDTLLLHLLNTYPPGVQQYGREKFTNLKEIKAYFGMKYLEWGECCYADMEGARTYFLGHW